MAASWLRPAAKATRGAATKGVAPRAIPAGTALASEDDDDDLGAFGAFGAFSALRTGTAGVGAGATFFAFGSFTFFAGLGAGAGFALRALSSKLTYPVVLVFSILTGAGFGAGAALGAGAGFDLTGFDFLLLEAGSGSDSNLFSRSDRSIDMAPLLDAREVDWNATFFSANCFWFAVGAKPDANGATAARTATVENFIFD